MKRGRRPAIGQVGRVVDTGTHVVITGWGLGPCLGDCFCHHHPHDGHMTVLQDVAAGRLGLRSYRPGGCRCCEPWEADELAAVVKFLADLEALPTVPPAPQTSA